MKDGYPIDQTGMVHVPQKPGVGVDLDWTAIDRTCVEHKISRS
jgi:L-alanine-DL-glutamate epimerase-like enolase superfamily enzyme